MLRLRSPSNCALRLIRRGTSCASIRASPAIAVIAVTTRAISLLLCAKHLFVAARTVWFGLRSSRGEPRPARLPRARPRGIGRSNRSSPSQPATTRAARQWRPQSASASAVPQMHRTTRQAMCYSVGHDIQLVTTRPSRLRCDKSRPVVLLNGGSGRLRDPPRLKKSPGLGPGLSRRLNRYSVKGQSV